MNAFRPRRDKAPVAYDILPPEAISQPRPRQPITPQPVEDAHFVTLANDGRPSTAHRFQNDNQKRPHRPRMQVVNAEPASLVERLIERVEGMLLRMSADFFSALVAFVFVLVFTLAGGFSLLSGDTGSSARAGGLDITHITLTSQDAGGMQVLLINGIVENRTSRSMAVPSIRVEFLVDGKPVATSMIAPPIATIDRDNSHGFSARVPHPGGKTPQLRLSFS
ncbi:MULTISPECIES: hypothetical protein [unclassified Rhizobium]|uniref:hypothetical protein n=1 Tax=unclassified Rhizobium TaxID=2613769 RepID=UPI003D27CE80